MCASTFCPRALSGVSGSRGPAVGKARPGQPGPGRWTEALSIFHPQADSIWWQLLDSPQMRAYLCWPVCATGALPVGSCGPAHRCPGRPPVSFSRGKSNPLPDLWGWQAGSVAVGRKKAPSSELTGTGKKAGGRRRPRQMEREPESGQPTSLQGYSIRGKAVAVRHTGFGFCRTTD